jgi:dienelactone hydrolase
MRWIAACVVVLVCQAASATDSFKFSAEYGAYDVGFKVVQQYDQSRSYRPGVDAITGEPDPGPSGRPIQTLIWYPAASPGRPLVYADYLDLAGREDRFDLDEDQSRRIAEDALREHVPFGASTADIARIRVQPVHATADAPVAHGTFPLIIYAPSDGSSAFENDSLCEYLASHGYVVIASPSHGAHVRYMTDGSIQDTVENTRAQAADIGFLIGYGSSMANVDSAKVGVVAYSWGGMSSAFAAVADNRIDALVDIEGSVRYFPKVLAAAPEVTPDRIQVPLLFFADKEDPVAPGKDSRPNSFIARIQHADVTEIGLRKSTHRDLATDNLRFSGAADASGTTIAEKSESYAWIARYTRAFLDDVLKGDATAKAFMRATTESNHVPADTLAIVHRSSVGPSASVAGFAQALAKSGFDKALDTYATYTREHPGFRVPDDTFSAWFGSLSDLARTSDAIELCRLWVHVSPKSIDAWTDLGAAYEIANKPKEAVESYLHVVALDHHNQIALGRVNVLKPAYAN